MPFRYIDILTRLRTYNFVNVENTFLSMIVYVVAGYRMNPTFYSL